MDILIVSCYYKFEKKLGLKIFLFRKRICLNLTKIVLTGGPCAGKTKVFEALKKHISQKGIKLIAVAETATELINGGVRPYEAKKIMDFQDIVYSLQKCKEDMAQKALGINKGEESCVILFDRAIIDNKAYLPRQEDFDYLLTKYGDSEINLLDSYDYVINLFSLAACEEGLYNLASNNARFENPEEAKDLDQKTIEAWIGHKNIKVFNSFPTLEEKIDAVVRHIDNILNGTVTKSLQTYYVDTCNSDLSVYNDSNSKTVNIKDIHLENDKSPDLDLIITESTYKGNKSYQFSVKRETNDAIEDIYHKQITLQKRAELLATFGIKGVSERMELTFVENKQPYKINFYKDFTTLEVEENLQNKKLKIPANIVVDGKIEGAKKKELQSKMLVKKS